MPSRSRISTPWRSARSQTATANMPRRCSAMRGAVLLVEVRQHLGVAAAAEDVAAPAQLLAQGVVVVDLAVLRRPDAAVLVGEGLVAALHVDDREAARAERAALTGHVAGVVRAAVARSRRSSSAGRRLGRAGALASSSLNAPAMPHMAPP